MMKSDTGRGGCHCGNLRYVLGSDVPFSNWAARFCSCNFCVRHGGLYASHASASLSVTVKSARQLGRYRFATESADFCFCKNCGVLVFLTCDIDGIMFGLVNMNTLDERPAAMVDAPVMSYEGEAKGDRLARRRENWIANVQIHVQD